MSDTPEGIRDLLTQNLARELLEFDEARRRRLSHDLSADGSEPVAAAIVAPRSETEVQELVRLCHRHRIALSVRGGGVSYTLGYALQDSATVMLDLRRLDRVLEIRPGERIAVVEAGCTWAALDEAACAFNLEPLVHAPISGSVSTVGGAVSQGVPGSLDAVVGLRLVLPEGEQCCLGVLAPPEGRAAIRHSGPDWIGPFLGDCGAFGIKTSVALRLRTRPAVQEFRSFAADDPQSLLKVAMQVVAEGIVSRALILENWRGQSMARVEKADPLAFLRSAWARRRSDPFRWIRDVVGMGMRSREREIRLRWSLHFAVDGRSSAAVAADAQRIDALGVSLTPITAEIARGMQLKPYSLAGALGPEGERWLPVHGVVGNDRAPAALAAVLSCQERSLKELRAAGVKTTTLISVGDYGVTLEPMYLWPDERPEALNDWLPPARLARFPAAVPATELRSRIRYWRAELAAGLRTHGAVHLQVGRYYPYAAIAQGGAGRLTHRFKAMVDESGLVNRGILSGGIAPKTDDAV